MFALQSLVLEHPLVAQQDGTEAWDKAPLIAAMVHQYQEAQKQCQSRKTRYDLDSCRCEPAVSYRGTRNNELERLLGPNLDRPITSHAGQNSALRILEPCFKPRPQTSELNRKPERRVTRKHQGWKYQD